jgi:hypothetical protein
LCSCMMWTWACHVQGLSVMVVVGADPYVRMHGAFAVAEADAKLKGYLETAADCIYTIENSPTAQEDLRAVGTQKYVCPLERSSFVRRVPCLPGVCWSSRRCSWLTRSSVPWCVRVCVSGARSVPVQTVLVLEAVIVLLSPKHAFSGPNPSVFGASWAASHRLLLLPPPELARRLREVCGPSFVVELAPSLRAELLTHNAVYCSSVHFFVSPRIQRATWSTCWVLIAWHLARWMLLRFPRTTSTP